MSDTTFQPGSRCAGFTVEEKTDLPELNLTLIRLVHDRTGARHLHLAADDSNNLFAATFRTPPTDSTGIAHILEHTVLCGSHRYPVRDPFFSMIRRSLNTFMNAMTANDWTSYPFASQNPRDFDNLLGVYLDAVFFPLLREEDFLQEGHRLEFAAETDDAPLTIQGVVYNEMKGAMASPASLLGRRLARALYPTTTYRHNSGGEPEAIPELTWQDLRAFHARYYHPSNSWLFSYGNLPLEHLLEQVDRLALSRFDRAGIDSEVPPEKRLDRPRCCEEPFPLDPGESPDRRSMVQVGWLANDIDDSYQRLVMNLVSLLLLGNPAAPLYRALLESGLGSNLTPGCGYHDDNRTTYFAAGLQGTDPERAEAIERLILDTLERVVGEGFSDERIAGALHRLEFANREVTGDSYPYPLLLMMRLLGPWLHADDPVSPLRLERHLDRLRDNLKDPGYLPGIIREMLLDNPHRVRLLLKPDTTLKQRQDEELARRLQQRRARLSAAEAEEIRRKAAELKARQEAEEDLSCLPGLGRQDIPEREETVPWRRHGENAGLLLFPQPTNGISYLVGHLACQGLEPERQKDLAIYAALLPQLGAAGRDYLQNAALAERYTGGLQAGTEILEEPGDAHRFRGELIVRGKALVRNHDKMLELLGDMLLAPDFDDHERLRTVLGQIRTSLENAIPGSGHSYAARYAAASLTPAAELRESWNGISLLRRIRALLDGSTEALVDWARATAESGRQMLRHSRLQCALVAEQRTLDDLAATTEAFCSRFAGGSEPAATERSFTPRPGQFGLATSVPVAYVVRTFATIPYTHPDAPLLLLLGKLLKAVYLHREIREKGGAYGGLASCDAEGGIFSMLSYRDPHIVRTLRVYDEAADWAAGGHFSQQELDEAILSVFSDLDRPLSPAGRAGREFANLVQGLKPELRQRFRRRVLAATSGDLARVAQRYLLDNRQRSAVTVIAGQTMLEAANRELAENERLVIERI
ncbi:hypothetical protein EDC39_10579 [Geothermobacter ehrlichii]|uniref:Peptidase M16C associated domain-containing protein n=1 Tax=Geothermobacter ehrlichii TaxID=213224 RepID=A0A5D3WJH5_9BACT|nr:insulinase family protein [Geothermobacter ehrlichii]TYO98717.1 hypothetical protein EDC39_10579 [Geothermobacter ehrlichii]